MHPHDRFYRACGHLNPWRRAFKCVAEWLVIACACLALVGMYGYCQMADQRAEAVAQGER